MIYQQSPGMYRINWNGLELGDGTGYRVQNLTGWDDDPGLDDASSSNFQSAGGQDGELLPTARTVTLELIISGRNEQETHELRLALLYATPITNTAARLVTDKGIGPEFVTARVVRRSIPLPVNFGRRSQAVLQWKANDPRRYSISEHVATLHPYQPPPGVDYVFDYPADYPESSDGYQNRASLVNNGNYDTPLTIELSGPLPTPSFTLRTPDRIRTYRVDFALAADDTLFIDPMVPAVTFNGTAPRYGSIRGALVEDLMVPPGESEILLNGAGAQEASLTVRWRDAIL